MKWWTIALGALLLLGAVAVLASQLLPARHVARSLIVLTHSPTVRVYALLADLETWPAWHRQTKSARRLPDRDGKPVVVLTQGRDEMPLIVEERQEPHRFVTRINEDAGLGYSGTWTYELSAAGDGTTLQITEEGTVHNPVFRLLQPLFDPHATMNATLRDLAAHLGESASPESL